MEAAVDSVRQVNFRIGKRAKQRGDAALRKRNLTPSQGIRLFYDCIGREDESAQEVLDLIAANVDETEQKRRERERKLASMRDFQAWTKQQYARMGLTTASPSPSQPSCDELREAAYLERFGEV